jgi:hypothetical protein
MGSDFSGGGGGGGRSSIIGQGGVGSLEKIGHPIILGFLALIFFQKFFFNLYFLVPIKFILLPFCNQILINLSMGARAEIGQKRIREGEGVKKLFKKSDSIYGRSLTDSDPIILEFILNFCIRYLFPGF